ncbi:hypothetical protein BU17DRAFT_63342 [Hysterangium stoloniferum]|nr:hypothetical protein BU17DRAFT_63342 [Hysterangium stoloniferum]
MFFLHAVWFPALLVGCYGVAAHHSDPVSSKLRLRQDVSSDQVLSPQASELHQNPIAPLFYRENSAMSHVPISTTFTITVILRIVVVTSSSSMRKLYAFCVKPAILTLQRMSSFSWMVGHNRSLKTRRIKFEFNIGEMDQCHREGIQISYSAPLDPVAEALVQVAYREGSVLRRNQTAFLALQIIGGHIGLFVVLIFAVFSRRIRRDPTFLNFCITWIFSSIVFSLMLYRGTSGNTILNTLGEVAPNQCLAQAALTEGAQVMTASSTLSLVVRLWISLRAAIYGESKGLKQDQWITAVLLVTPYMFFLVFALAAVNLGMQNIVVTDATLQRVIPVNFYCTVSGPTSFVLGVYGTTLALLLVTMGFDVHIISILYKHWAAFRHVKAKSAVSLSLLLRVIIFSLYRIVVAVAYVSVLKRPPQTGSTGQGTTLSVSFGFPVWVDMLQAAIPLLGAIILGIRNDMLSAITCWHWSGTDHTSSLRSVSDGDNTGSKHAPLEKDAIPEEPVKSEV